MSSRYAIHYGYFRKTPNRTQYSISFKNSTRNRCNKFNPQLKKYQRFDSELFITQDRVSQLDKEANDLFNRRVDNENRRIEEYELKRAELERDRMTKMKILQSQVKMNQERKTNYFRRLKVALGGKTGSSSPSIPQQNGPPSNNPTPTSNSPPPPVPYVPQQFSNFQGPKMNNNTTPTNTKMEFVG